MPGRHTHPPPPIGPADGLATTMKLAIFDLDDTLIDFAATRQVAYGFLAGVLDREGIDSKAYLVACAEVDFALFSRFTQGEITRAEYRNRRFSEPFTAMGLPSKAELVEQLNTLFMDCVNDSPLLYDDTRQVLERLRRQGVRTAILTNGPSDGQRRKLKATGLAEAVDHVAIGEELGFSKPSPQAFHSVVQRFGFDNAEALMIGDHPELDYDAALGAGLHALLLDRDDRHVQSGRRSIRTLDGVLMG
jgi:putative hydrolase of the HAD superfamily